MIRLEGLVKEYRGPGGAFATPIRALDGVSLEIPPGARLGLIGLNGAGKSTLLRVLLGYARPTDGDATVGGMPPRRYAERHGVAYVPERIAIPGGWTVRGALDAYAALGGIGAETRDRVEAVLHRLGLEPLADRKVKALSKGNVQRLAIAQALLGDRRLMILDEPTEGLDPVWVAELRQIVRDWSDARPERVLILASHHLAEVERIADTAIVLHEGRIRERIDLRDGHAGSLEERFLGLVRTWNREAAA